MKNKLVAESFVEWREKDLEPLNESYYTLEKLWKEKVDKNNIEDLKSFIRRVFDLTDSKVWEKFKHKKSGNIKFEKGLSNMSFDEIMTLIERIRKNRYEIRSYHVIDPEYSGNWKIQLASH